jgi:hypothetical protein
MQIVFSPAAATEQPREGAHAEARDALKPGRARDVIDAECKQGCIGFRKMAARLSWLLPRPRSRSPWCWTIPAARTNSLSASSMMAFGPM